MDIYMKIVFCVRLNVQMKANPGSKNDRLCNLLVEFTQFSVVSVSEQQCRSPLVNPVLRLYNAVLFISQRPESKVFTLAVTAIRRDQSEIVQAQRVACAFS